MSETDKNNCWGLVHVDALHFSCQHSIVLLSKKIYSINNPSGEWSLKVRLSGTLEVNL